MFFLKVKTWASLVVQWLRVCLPVQGTRVRALVWEDAAGRGAAGPVQGTRVRALVWEDAACRGAAGPVGHGC